MPTEQYSILSQGGLESRASSLVARLLARWQAVLLILAGLVQLVVLAPQFTSGRPSIGGDALLFEYSGLAATQGALPYVHLWDPKPPLTHELAAGLAFISGGDPFVLHALSVGLMSMSAIASTVLIAHVVFTTTESEAAAFATGLVLLAFPAFYLAPARGLRPKMFVILIGFLSVFFLQRDRFALAGVTAAIAAGFWQFGVLFPLVALISARRHDHSALLHVGGGIVLVTVAALFPFVVRGGLWALLSQVVVAPFVTSDSVGFFERAIRAARVLVFTAPLLLVGGFGLALAARSSSTTWVALGGLWFTVQVAFLDFDGAPDLFVWVAFLAIGYGLVVAHSEPTRQHLLVGGAALAAVAMVYWTTRWGGFAPASPAPLTPASLKWYYWTGAEPDSCHLRRSGMERQFVEQIGGRLTDRTCTSTLRSLLQLF